MFINLFIKTTRFVIIRSASLTMSATNVGENIKVKTDEVIIPDEAKTEEVTLSKKQKKKLYQAGKKDILKAKREEHQASKQVGYSKDTLNDTEYYLEDGYRKVKVNFV
jgi:hypothetical protein